MPVILDNGSDSIWTWLDPKRTEWSRDLQSLLKPYEGELECYPVSKDVGKVGNNSPSFLIPIDSAENKNNIANFFGKQRKLAKKTESTDIDEAGRYLKSPTTKNGRVKVEHDADETRDTTDRVEGTENNAPQPVPDKSPSQAAEVKQGVKREAEDNSPSVGEEQHAKRNKTASPQKQAPLVKTPAKRQGTRSATSNGSAAKTPVKSDGNAKITSFFSNK